MPHPWLFGGGREEEATTEAASKEGSRNFFDFSQADVQRIIWMGIFEPSQGITEAHLKLSPKIQRELHSRNMEGRGSFDREEESWELNYDLRLLSGVSIGRMERRLSVVHYQAFSPNNGQFAITPPSPPSPSSATEAGLFSPPSHSRSPSTSSPSPLAPADILFLLDCYTFFSALACESSASSSPSPFSPSPSPFRTVGAFHVLLKTEKVEKKLVEALGKANDVEELLQVISSVSPSLHSMVSNVIRTLISDHKNPLKLEQEEQEQEKPTVK
jgi:hypothetical protein